MKGWANCPRCGGTGFEGILLCHAEPPQGRRYIGEAWATYEARCMHPDAGPAQRQEVQGAFYAGAMVVFATLQAEVSEGDDITSADLDVMVAIDRELEEYGALARARAEASRKKAGRA